MNTRKIFTKFVLTVAAFFWAGCGDDSDSKHPVVGPISDCSDDDSLNNGNMSSHCGGGMIALYGVAPVFDESSSSVSSSDSCGQNCDEMISSSSVESSSSSSSLVDREAARARGEALCAEHEGVKDMFQYQPPWGTPELWADQEAREEVRDSVEKVLKTDKAKKFSSSKKSCLEKFANSIEMVAMYGSPMPDEENPHDIWLYTCNNGEMIKDEAYLEKDREYGEAFDAAKKEYLEKYRKEVDDCGKS